MGRTQDGFGGVRQNEEGTNYIEGSGLATAEGQVRYYGGRFSQYDSSGEYDPRSGGGGITEAQHEQLDRLTHNINETSFDEIITSGGKITSIITWDSASKTLKIREELYTYSGNKVTQIVTIQYDASGVEKERNTEVIAYSGNIATDITRTHI